MDQLMICVPGRSELVIDATPEMVAICDEIIDAWAEGVEPAGIVSITPSDGLGRVVIPRNAITSIYQFVDGPGRMP